MLNDVRPPQSEHSDAASDWRSPAYSAAECGECLLNAHCQVYISRRGVKCQTSTIQ
jgi:hypothetical protein